MHRSNSKDSHNLQRKAMEERKRKIKAASYEKWGKRRGLTVAYGMRAYEKKGVTGKN